MMSEQAQINDYMKKKEIKKLLHNLLQHVTLHKPVNVYDFLIDILETGVEPKAPNSPVVIRNTLETGKVNELHDEETDQVLQVNQYHIGKLLGRGGFAQVFIGEVNGLLGKKQTFAIKVMDKKRLKRKRVGRFSNALQLLKKEIAVWKKVTHPNVVNLVEVIDDDEHHHCYLVSEIMPRGQVLPEGENVDPLPIATAKKYMIDLFKGLSYLHFQEVAHRDIKPGNMLLDKHGTVKVTDFGVSQMFENDGCREEDLVGNTAGTPHFMSPEMVQKGKFHAKKHDIWSAGITLYMMSVGHPPFRAKSIPALFDQIEKGEIDYNHKIFDENADLKEFVQFLLQKNPDERPTADEVLLHPYLGTTTKKPEYEKIEITAEEENRSITQANFDQMLHIKHYAHMAKVRVQQRLTPR